jgi:hypothetical protein
MDVLHSGFDGLKFTVDTDIPPELRSQLMDAKALAVATNRETAVLIGGLPFSVRRTGGSAFSVTTGTYGAEWYFLDPENRPTNNPGVTADFAAFLLATGGLAAAQAHFETHMAALGITYADTQLRASRVDFAVDILAPWFEPDREALVVPPGTRVREFAEADETVTHATGARVVGLRAGAVSSRQLVIYDKRAQVLETGKMGWVTIWNAAREKLGKPPLDLKDRQNSLVWRFELRMGSKQLRNKWAIRSWFDLDAMVGDAYAAFFEKVRYCEPTTDSNRSRWPKHHLWRMVESVVGHDLKGHRSGVVPDDVKTANREEHKRMLDMQILGLLVSRAATEGISADQATAFFKRHLTTLCDVSQTHPVPLEERLAKAADRYLFR